MNGAALLAAPEHLSPHDLVTYSRCPHEMVLHRQARNEMLHGGAPLPGSPPADLAGAAERHSPLFAPPLHNVTANEGRLDLYPSDLLVYEDDDEEGLPVLFPPERVRPDPALGRHGFTLIDDELGLSGRPDLVVRRDARTIFPIEYKSTHLFTGFHEAHGRAFDVIQAIAECRLVHAATGLRPARGIVLYGDVKGDGEREGWVEVPYTDAEERWLRAALAQVRADRDRHPVPNERNCAACEPNRDGRCRYAAVRFGWYSEPVARPRPAF